MERWRKAQSSVIVLVLIVLIAIVAILIVWNIFNPLIKKKGEEVGLEKLTTSLEIKEVVLIGQGASKITVSRGTGKAELTGLKFVFYDENGNSNVVEEKTTLPELGTEMYSFSPFSNLGKIKRVSVFPVIGNNLGIESKSEASKIIQVPNGLISWWRFDNADDFLMKNNCRLISGNLNGVLENGNLNCGNDSSLNMEKEIGISFWIKTSSRNGGIIKKGDNYNVFLENGFVNFSYWESEVKSDVTINDENWHHVATTIMGIYIDGFLHSSKIMSFTAGVNSDELKIGDFNGLLDEVMIFNESLANTEVIGLYNNQKT